MRKSFVYQCLYHSLFSLLLLASLIAPLFYHLGMAVFLSTKIAPSYVRIISIICLGMLAPLVATHIYYMEEHKKNPCPIQFQNTNNNSQWFLGANLSLPCREHGGPPATFHTDSFGRRINGNPSLRAYNKLIVGAGCSLTFGYGVNDEDTLSSQIEKVSHNQWQALNFGVPGGGLDNVIYLIHNLEKFAPEVIKKKDFVFLYTMHPDHVHRYSQSGNWFFFYQSAQKKNRIPTKELSMPKLQYYTKRFGYFLLNYKLTSTLKEIILDNYSRIFLSYRYHHEFYTKTEEDLFIQDINQTANFFYQKYPKATFAINFWYLHNQAVSTQKSAQHLLQQLDKRIKLYIQPLEETASLNAPDYGHPTGEVYRRAATRLVNEFLDKL